MSSRRSVCLRILDGCLCGVTRTLISPRNRLLLSRTRSIHQQWVRFSIEIRFRKDKVLSHRTVFVSVRVGLRVSMCHKLGHSAPCGKLGKFSCKTAWVIYCNFQACFTGSSRILRFTSLGHRYTITVLSCSCHHSWSDHYHLTSVFCCFSPACRIPSAGLVASPSHFMRLSEPPVS